MTEVEFLKSQIALLDEMRLIADEIIASAIFRLEHTYDWIKREKSNRARLLEDLVKEEYKISKLYDRFKKDQLGFKDGHKYY